MRAIPSLVAKSLERSRVRRRVLSYLARNGEAYAAQLVFGARIDAKRLMYVMRGSPPRYRRERALLVLGLVTVEHTMDGALYRITPEGRRVSEEIAARRGRLH